VDVNGLPFRLIAGPADFGFGADAKGDFIARHLALSHRTGHLRLASEQARPALAEDEMFSRGQLSQPSPVADLYGSFAWWNGVDRRIEASGFLPSSVEIELGGDGSSFVPSDMMLGTDDILYVARGGAVLRHDLRERWRAVVTRHSTLSVDLLAPAPGGGGWALDRTARKLMRIGGSPLRFAELRGAASDTFGPAEPNPDPPRLNAMPGSDIREPLDPVGMAVSRNGRLAVLAWESGRDAVLLLYTETGFVEQFRLAGLRFPYSLAWVGEDSVAVMASDGPKPAAQAFVYPLQGSARPEESMSPDGRIFLLRNAWQGGFCNALHEVPRHLQSAEAGPPTAIRPLRALSGDSFAREGAVLIGPVDGGVEGCVWHRFYAEAALSDHTAIEVALMATDLVGQPAMPTGPEDRVWARHMLLPEPYRPADAGVPLAAWLGETSEIANAPPLLRCPQRPGRAGLFDCLVQHAGRKVRRVEGRYLWIVLTLRGDSRGSPELAALRFYGQRRSWRDRYLPAFYGETLGGEAATADGPATPNDFMERFLHNYEGVLTVIEGRIAGSWQLTDPATAPDHALPWLGRWIGIDPRNGESAAHLRQRLLAAPHTARLGGTCGGLLAALEMATGGRIVTGGRLDRGRRVPAPGELAMARAGDLSVRGLMLAVEPDGNCVFLTGGAVTRGDIVAIEGFRLRRTFATILGADLADKDDPLTLGLAVSGNSFVGDTLILGDAAREELLALYRPEIDAAQSDTDGVGAFYARLAWRVLVLVRGVDDESEFRRLSDIVAEEIPAHVEPQVLHARSPLIVGAASLLGLDTYLTEPSPVETARIDQSWIGNGDVIAGSGRLDARADGPVSPPPHARADGPVQVWLGDGFTLSALASEAAARRRIERFIWTWDKES
jgi:phage tail-like protein